MPSPPPVDTTTSGYTTIPISGTDVISRSFQNLSTFLSRCRPWPEFLATAASYSRPDSLAAAAARYRVNSKYFAVNYTLLLSAAAAASLLGSPLTLIIFVAVYIMWLTLYYFREDPMVIYGRHVSDHVVLVGLVLVTCVAVWLSGVWSGLWVSGILNDLVIGISIGVLALSVHVLLRNPEGFLDENDALASGLIGSQPV